MRSPRLTGIKRDVIRPLLIGGLLLLPMFALGAEVSVAVGASYATGDYGYNDSIDDVYVPVSVEVNTERLVLWVTVPYAYAEGPAGSLRLSDGFVPGEGPQRSSSGLGDIVTSLTLKNLFESSNGNYVVDLTGTVKFGTADENDGLGTGETDYSAQLDGYRFFDAGAVFGTLGYKVRGDSSDYDLKDTWFVAAGGVIPISQNTSMSASLSYRPEVSSGGNAASEITLIAAHWLNNGWRIQGHVLAGLADDSPDWGVGMQVKFPI